VNAQSLSRRSFLGAATLAASPLARTYAAARPPNIVVILADDQGWGDLSIHGNTNLSTLRIDSLGREGAKGAHSVLTGQARPPAMAT